MELTSTDTPVYQPITTKTLILAPSPFESHRCATELTVPIMANSSTPDQIQPEQQPDVTSQQSSATVAEPTTDAADDNSKWADFTPPPSLPVSHPYLFRYYSSTLLHNRAIASNSLSTALTRSFGNPSHPIAFTIGNGGAGYTGLFKPLCAQFIWKYGSDFRIGWVANHSRHSQIALLGGVVQVALTYEPEWEEVMEGEGWGRVVRPGSGSEVGGNQVFWDHFVLVGPREDGTGLGSAGGLEIREALRRIAQGEKGVKFFSRGDGSATFNQEQRFWRDVGLEPESLECVETHPLPPYKALVNAEEGGAYMLSDRATYLTAKRDGLIPNLRVYVEGGADLLNPCSASVNTKVPDSVGQRLAVRFAEWLGEPQAQGIFSGYGRVWDIGLPLLTNKDRKEFADEESLVGRNL